MKQREVIILFKITTVALLFANFLYASGDILQLLPDPVSCSLGNISTTMNRHDIWAVYNNQANLAIIENESVSLSYKRIANSFNFVSAAYVKPFGKNQGTGGLSVSYLSYGEDLLINGLTPSGDPILTGESYTSYDILVNFGYGISLKDLFHAGLGIKYFSSNLADDSKSYFCGDINILKKFDSGMILGLNLRNIALQKSELKLPSHIAIGVSYPALFSKSKNYELSVLGEFRYYLEDAYCIDKYDTSIGLKYRVNKFEFNSSVSVNNNEHLFIFNGLGLSYYMEHPLLIKIDYSINSIASKELGMNHSFSVSYFFKKEVKKSEPKEPEVKGKVKEKHVEVEPEERDIEKEKPKKGGEWIDE